MFLLEQRIKGEKVTIRLKEYEAFCDHALVNFHPLYRPKFDIN